MLTEQHIHQALQSVMDPLTGQALANPKNTKNLSIQGGDVSFEVEMGYPAKSLLEDLRQQLIAAVRALPSGVTNCEARVPKMLPTNSSKVLNSFSKDNFGANTRACSRNSDSACSPRASQMLSKRCSTAALPTALGQLPRLAVRFSSKMRGNDGK